MKKSLILMMCLFLLVGCGQNTEKSSNTEEENKYNDREQDFKDETSSNAYNFFDSVELVNDTKWIVLEDYGDSVLLFATVNVGSSSKSQLDDKISSYKEKMKKELKDSNGFEARIPTSDDMTKYFKVDFNKKDSVTVDGMTLEYSQYQLLSAHGWSSFWIVNNLTDEWEDQNLACKVKDNTYKFGCLMTESTRKSDWRIAPIIKVKKSNIKD